MEKRRILSSDYQMGKAMEKALQGSGNDIIETVKSSGLRGRGGAGFPTGMKWDFAAKSHGDNRYVVCNADEGEPGTFKDRVLLTEHFESMVEGMAIAGYAINANTGILYLRGEYKWMLPGLQSKLNEMRNKGLLGRNISGSNFSFDIEFRFNAGAYVCGEETALIESAEGKRGEPRNKPPYPVAKGYMESPTIVNNVETFCYIPFIVSNGADEFRKCGTEKSPGTKLFSISGDCDRPGVYEFEMGIKVSEMLNAVGAKNTKAVQLGGASGVMVGQNDFDKQICFEGLPPGGSIIVFNNKRSMVHVLKNFMEFFVEESCGQCTPCREGNARLLEAVEKVERGESLSEDYLNTLLELAEVMSLASKCGLGQCSSNSFVHISKNFKNELLKV